MLMTPQTDIRFNISIATVQLQPSELTDADLRAPADVFVRLTHANDRCREGKLYVHKALAEAVRQDGTGSKGALQSAMFDLDKSNGRQELKELCDALKETILEKMYEGRIIA